MQPVIPYSQADLSSKGLDIVLLLDLSSSMQEEMGSGQIATTTTTVAGGRTRMDAVKDAVKTFIRTRRDDRIGLVVFSDNPYVISPLTFDHEYLLHYIDFVDDKILQGEGQTAIGDGLALSNYVLSRQATPTRAATRWSCSSPTARATAAASRSTCSTESKDADIRVHVVGVDLEADVKEKPGVQMLMRGGRGRRRAVFQRGFRARPDRGVAHDRSIEKGLLVSRVYVRDVPVYQWFAIPALVTLVLAPCRCARFRTSSIRRRVGGRRSEVGGLAGAGGAGCGGRGQSSHGFRSVEPPFMTKTTLRSAVMSRERVAVHGDEIRLPGPARSRRCVSFMPHRFGRQRRQRDDGVHRLLPALLHADDRFLDVAPVRPGDGVRAVDDLQLRRPSAPA